MSKKSKQYMKGFHAGIDVGERQLVHQLLKQHIIFYPKTKGYGSAVKWPVDTQNLDYECGFLTRLQKYKEASHD
jgi:hypothetical protein